ncbi:MAG: SAM-dependent methyltransferase [Candidatus Azotimanducaceae bacterium]|jgi:SAM-dependent methyltransferase
MATQDINAYYHSTEHSEVRADLSFAISLLSDERIAVDCGCGAGSDIAFLRRNDFTVYAYDIEQASIQRCRKRFKDDGEVLLSHDSFSSFIYPRASLIVADASLFFCPKSEFEHVWSSMRESIKPKGVFCGSFLGPRDTMAGPDHGKDSFWPDVMVFTEAEVRENFTDFEIIKFTEHEVSGETAQGKSHHWHIFSVVAKIC